MAVAVQKGGPAVPRNHKRAQVSSIGQYLGLGVTGAAMIGAGVMLAAQPDGAAPVTAQVMLASTQWEMPLSPAANVDCTLIVGGCGDALGKAGPPTPTALAAASATFAPMIGPGGWLIGDGLDADATTCTAPCNGGNAGLLWGNGGRGALGGNGGNAGFYFGNGGDGYRVLPSPQDRDRYVEPGQRTNPALLEP